MQEGRILKLTIGCFERKKAQPAIDLSCAFLLLLYSQINISKT